MQAYKEPETYSEASQRLQLIIERIKDENCDIDRLADYVEEAHLLLIYCQEKLAETGIKIRSILDSVHEDTGNMDAQILAKQNED